MLRARALDGRRALFLVIDCHLQGQTSISTIIGNGQKFPFNAALVFSMVKVGVISLPQSLYRTEQIPMMEDVFGTGFLSHLSAVARESNDLRELVHQELFQPVWDRAVVQPLGMRLEVESLRYESQFTVSPSRELLCIASVNFRFEKVLMRGHQAFIARLIASKRFSLCLDL